MHKNINKFQFVSRSRNNSRVRQIAMYYFIIPFTRLSRHPLYTWKLESVLNLKFFNDSRISRLSNTIADYSPVFNISLRGD